MGRHSKPRRGKLLAPYAVVLATASVAEFALSFSRGFSLVRFFCLVIAVVMIISLFSSVLFSLAYTL